MPDPRIVLVVCDHRILCTVVSWKIIRGTSLFSHNGQVRVDWKAQQYPLITIMAQGHRVILRRITLCSGLSFGFSEVMSGHHRLRTQDKFIPAMLAGSSWRGLPPLSGLTHPGGGYLH